MVEAGTPIKNGMGALIKEKKKNQLFKKKFYSHLKFIDKNYNEKKINF